MQKEEAQAMSPQSGIRARSVQPWMPSSVYATKNALFPCEVGLLVPRVLSLERFFQCLLEALRLSVPTVQLRSTDATVVKLRHREHVPGEM